MAPRASWKGYLKLSLVSCPVRLYTATTTADRISFHMLHKDTHNRVQMKPHDPEIGVVSRSDLVKGYEFEKDQYVIVTDDDLAQVQIESTKTISIETFVDENEIDPIYFDSTYYLAPDGPVAEETYRVVHEAMGRAGKAAIARVVLSGRERPVIIMVRGEGFALRTLRSAKEVRGHESYFEGLEEQDVDNEMLELAEMIIKKHKGSFDPAKFEDRYQVALKEIVQGKLKGSTTVIAKAPERGKVINLMDALRRSLEQGGSKKPPAKSKRKPAVKKSAKMSTAAKAKSRAKPKKTAARR